MLSYKDLDCNSYVEAYECGSNYILVQYKSGALYKYTYDSTGSYQVEKMKKLADEGKGLNRFIDENVRNNFER